MAGAVGAAVGVVSTVAGMGEQSRQRNIQRQQAQVQQYAQEVQYEQEKMSIKHQREFANQTRQLEDTQLKSQDLQIQNSLTEQALQARSEEAQLDSQLKLKQVQDESALSTANRALQLAEYQQGELERQRRGAADSRQSETMGQVTQSQSEVAKLLSEGKQAQAAALLMETSQGQQDSITTGLQTDRRQEVSGMLRTLMEQGNLTEDAVRQALYEKDVASTLKDAGLLDVMLERIGVQSQYDVNNSTRKAQQDLLTTGKRKNAIGEDLANKTLAGGTMLRDQQRGIDKQFSDMGYQAQGDNAGIRNAGIMSSLQAQQASAKGSLFTTLANAAAIGGSLYNAYEQVRPITPYSSPVRTQPSYSVGPAMSQPAQQTQRYLGPALPQVGPYGPVDTRR